MDLTKQELFFKNSMGVLAIAFLVCGILFVAIPDQILGLTNIFAGVFGMTKAPQVTEIKIPDLQPFPYSRTVELEGRDRLSGPPRLWISLGFAMMILITVLCLMNYLDPRKYIGWTPLLLVSKFTSSTTGLVSFLAGERYFADLVVFIVDFPIFLFVAFVYWRAKRSAKQY